MDDFDAAYGALETLARDLHHMIGEERTELKELLAGRRTIPHGSSSPAAAAADTFARIRSRASDVINAADQVEQVIRKTGAWRPDGR
jgi:hypothetical protein